MTKCPICGDQYYSVNRSNDVCENHQNWIVTRCSSCGRICFSDCMGICNECCPDTPRTLVGGGKDRRAILRHYGLEDYE